MTVEGGKTGEGRIRKGSYAAPALDKAFLIIELLASHPQGMLVSEMATALGRSLGELFRIVVVMEEARYLEKSPIDDRYRVTYKFLDIAYRATPARQLTAAALPEMQSLALTVGQSCHLVVIEGGAGLVIAREENPGTRGFALRMGASIDIVTSCSGKVLLAFAPRRSWDGSSTGPSWRRGGRSAGCVWPRIWSGCGRKAMNCAKARSRAA